MDFTFQMMYQLDRGRLVDVGDQLAWASGWLPVMMCMNGFAVGYDPAKGGHADPRTYQIILLTFCRSEYFQKNLMDKFEGQLSEALQAQMMMTAQQIGDFLDSKVQNSAEPRDNCG